MEGDQHVYLVMGYVHYEGADVLGAYENEEAAEADKAMREEQWQGAPYHEFYVDKLRILSTPQEPKKLYKVCVVGCAPDRAQEDWQKTEDVWPDADGNYPSAAGEKAWIIGQWGQLCKVVGQSEQGFDEAKKLALAVLKKVSQEHETRF